MFYVQSNKQNFRMYPLLGSKFHEFQSKLLNLMHFQYQQAHQPFDHVSNRFHANAQFLLNYSTHNEQRETNFQKEK